MKKEIIILNKEDIKELRSELSVRHNNKTFEKTFDSYLNQFRNTKKENIK